MTTTLELHIIQSYPVNRLNRGRDGAPKSVVFGGVRRARISSQAQKRAERSSQAVLLQDVGPSYRTKRPQELLIAALAPEYTEVLETDGALTTVMGILSSLYGAYDDKGRLKTQVLLGTDEIDRLTKLIGPSLSALIKLPKEEQAHRAQALTSSFKSGTQSPDVALYGRFLAETDGWDVEAACSYSHAIGTHRLSSEIDFFSAVDDVSGDVAHIGETDLTAPTMYRVASLDLDQLRRNLPTAPLTDLVQAWASRAVTSTPGSGQHGAFAHTLPEYVLIIARAGGHPINLAGAFEVPIRQDANGSLAQNSVKALEEHLSGLDRLYGPFGRVYAATVTTFDLAGASSEIERGQSLRTAVSRALERSPLV